jgi:predicted  nucleic acid-binding Zn-ribbon protein
MNHYCIKCGKKIPKKGGQLWCLDCNQKYAEEAKKTNEKRKEIV